ncbi:MAG: hypothetical protein DRG20_01650 [Deltaproteobacteria bacterium]|nr:MAG: hypothetical protein DRG20_01650 [Deltaproteobacteria bacterium]
MNVPMLYDKKWLFIILFWFMWFFNFSSRVVVGPVLPIIEDNLAISHGASGGLVGLCFVGYGLSQLISGIIASRVGYRRTILAGFLILIFALIGAFFTRSYRFFALFFFLIGLAGGAYLPSIIYIITKKFPYESWGKAVGIHDSAAPSAIFATPILVAFIITILNWRSVFLVIAFFCLIVSIIFFISIKEPESHRKAGMPEISIWLKKKSTWILFLLWIIAAGLSTGTYNIFPLYLVKERGLSITFANKIFGITRIGGILLPVISGILADKIGFKKIIFFAIIIDGILTLFLGFSLPLSVMVILLFLQATIISAFFPVGLIAVSSYAYKEIRSLAVGGSVAIAAFIGAGFTPFALGVIADYLSFATSLIIFGTISIIFSFFAFLLK